MCDMGENIFSINDIIFTESVGMELVFTACS